MKSFKALLMLTAMFILSMNVCLALQSTSISSQDEHNKEVSEQINDPSSITMNVDSTQQMQLLFDRYKNDFKTCEPMHYKQYIDFFGLKINLQMDINGWNSENKCEYYMSGNIDSIGKDIREVYGVKVPDEKIADIKPIIQCHFTQSQLDLLIAAVESSTQKQEKTIEKMLKNPQAKYSEGNTEKMTKEEKEVVNMLTDGSTCVMPNIQELMQQVSELMGESQDGTSKKDEAK